MDFIEKLRAFLDFIDKNDTVAQIARQDLLPH
jgi:hypothetical protein